MPIDPAKPFDLLFTVDPHWADLRLDLYLKRMMPAISRVRLQRYIREGRVEVNGKARPANWRVRLGDHVLLRCREPAEGADAGRHIPLHILYEDDDIVAVNKQAGLVVHPVGLHRHDTLMNAIYWRYRDILPESQAISLVNRLDQFTSGIVLVAKNTAAKQALQEQFEARQPRKTYLALCVGWPDAERGEIDLPLGPALSRKHRCQMGVRYDGAGKPSHTSYEVIERCRGIWATAEESKTEGEGGEARFSLVRLTPHTGRTHQLRVHMAAIDHPLAADDRYGDGCALCLTLTGEPEVILERYALHAAEISFRHPRSQQPITIAAPLAEDIAQAVSYLQRGAVCSRLALRRHQANNELRSARR